MNIHRLHKGVYLPITLEEAWDFFSNPENLDKITPDDMDFNIISGADKRTYAGQLIIYKLKPLLNIPITWVTEITQCLDHQYFIDEQRFGPYKLWHHMHRFSQKGDGVWMEDLLHYALPYGFVGTILGNLFIHRKVQGIFEHRQKILSELFPGTSTKNANIRDS